MASVFKYKNNKPEQTIDKTIKKFSREYKVDYIVEQHKHKKSFVDKSIQNLAVNSIIEGYFPKENLVKDMAIKRVNNTLCIILSLLISIVVISYYFVISCEVKLNNLSKQTIILNNKNEELQNKLDTLKSFNNVDKTLEEDNILQRAGHVIETQKVVVDKSTINKKINRRNIFTNAIGF